MNALATTIRLITATVLLATVPFACGGYTQLEESDDEWFQPFDVPPVLVHYEEPRYPAGAKQSQLEGWVRVKMLVGVEGRVERAEVLESSDPVFEEPALEAAKSFRFEPAQFHGRRVRAAVMVPVRFEL